jgi:hypothetical protein
LEGLAASITTLIMEAASTSETTVNFHQTKQRNFPEDSYLLTQGHKNLKSHKNNGCSLYNSLPHI